jgi:hypothetical protein
MRAKRYRSIAVPLLVVILVFAANNAFTDDNKASSIAPPAKPTMAKICANCHQPDSGNLRGYFDNVAYKTQSIAIRMDDAVEILRFDKDTLKVMNVQPDPANPAEPLRMIKRGKEVRVEYFEKDGKKFATLVVSKPPLKVAPEKLIITQEVEKLVAMGPEKGEYTLIDCRPTPKFMEGAIQTAVNIPYPAFEKNIDKLPKDKSRLIVYYCSGVT